MRIHLLHFVLLTEIPISGERRAAHHTKQLLDLIKQFPRVNPPDTSDLDIPRLFRQIRSRYKALCSTLGVKPSLRAAGASPSRDQAEDPVQSEAGREGGAGSVWELDNQPKKPSAHGLDF